MLMIRVNEDELCCLWDKILDCLQVQDNAGTQLALEQLGVFLHKDTWEEETKTT